MSNPSTLREAIVQVIVNTYADGVLDNNMTQVLEVNTDAILDAVIAALPTKLNANGLFSQYGEGHDAGVDKVKAILQSAKGGTGPEAGDV